jgi:hypothetical protein
VFLSLSRYICWWPTIPRGYHSPSSQCFYHWVDTSADGLLVPESIIRPVVKLGRYICWWTIIPRGYQPPSNQCFYHSIADVSTQWYKHWLLGGWYPRGIMVNQQRCRPSDRNTDYWADDILLFTEGNIRPVDTLGRYICWWTIIPRGYHPPSSQCFYHSVDTFAGGLLFGWYPRGIIVHQQIYRLSDRNTDYWADDTLGE